MIDFTREIPITVTELAEFLGVSRKTVDNWRAMGLESCHVGRLVYTSLEAVNRFAVQDEPEHHDERVRYRRDEDEKAARELERRGVTKD